ncbi:RNA-binding transcriptional accessory protein [Desulfuribacillus stibiiarsenatis]|uniref:RNA-binding transcriptional accessory protein n=1 Tax=Desulfuribacillus stibiiarsenatis TaxID=1390249 RepID=A0A1E5L477_9FIRM|nr:Tex family protein [Desulfuribacillus stibiiarsenatis]OEH84938.1 RNA-binding transcriptional accessory protein [Desulfuribacillus stibiiarsenatis]
MSNPFISTIAKEIQWKPELTEKAVALLDEGNTIPFISRYRKEMTGSMDEETLRTVQERMEYLRSMAKRKEEILSSIGEQGKLTPELQLAIEKAQKLQELEDIYLPFRPKRKTRASVAKEKGLEPLAEWIAGQPMSGNLAEEATQYINAELGVETIEEAIQGALDIIAEQIAETAEIRKKVRQHFRDHATLQTVAIGEEADDVYQMYFQYEEAIKKLPPHRVLAINRGEREKALKVTSHIAQDTILEIIERTWGIVIGSTVYEQLKATILDSYKRLLEPSIEREIRKEKTEQAESKAIEVFKANLKSLLLIAPVKNKVVMGVDPAYRTGCKISVVDQTGKLLKVDVTYPISLNKNSDKDHVNIEKAKATFYSYIKQYQVDIIAIGNGTASRETEQFVAELIRHGKEKQMFTKEVHYIIVDEAGASVYSASPIAKKEFPELDVAERSAASIARRLQDPLAELVKIDPKSIGIGQYQHDVAQKQLSESLQFVVETVVNSVGVDLNTASTSLLKYISGINETVANNIVAYREEIGTFSNRKQVQKVPRLGAKSYEQCVGFLRIRDGKEPLDNTPIHPESYEIARKLLKHLGFDSSILTMHQEKAEYEQKLKDLNIRETAEMLEVGVPTLTDIVEALLKPGRDPRDELQKPALKSDILSLDDLEVGVELQGTIRNVVDFGAFVDIGLKNDGLVHISEISNQYVKHPLEIVQVGQIVKVKVIDIDRKRSRVGLSMK